jgi:hypothetical protein
MRSDAILDSILEGRTRLGDAPQAVQSWARLPIYNMACAILELPTKETRREELRRVPELLRDTIEAEVMRVWELRRQGS